MNAPLNSLVTAKVSDSGKRAFLEKVVASANDSRFTPELIEHLQNSCKSGHPGRHDFFSTPFANVLISWIGKPQGATNDPEDKVKFLKALPGNFARPNTKSARSVAEDIRQAVTYYEVIEL